MAQILTHKELLEASYRDALQAIGEHRVSLDDAGVEALAREPIIQNLASRKRVFDAAVRVEADGSLSVASEPLALWLTHSVADDVAHFERLVSFAKATGAPNITSLAAATVATAVSHAKAELDAAVRSRKTLEWADYAKPVAVLFLFEPKTAFERLAAYVDAAGDATETSVRVGCFVLQLMRGDGSFLNLGLAGHSGPVADPRWIELCSDLLASSNARLKVEATTTLRRQGDAVFRAAVATHGAKVGKKTRVFAAVPSKVDFVERYRAGEHAAVWAELRALGATARDPAVLAQATEVALETMQRVRRNAEAIAKRLAERGYKLKNVKKAVAPPAKDIEKRIVSLGNAIGVPVPLSLQAFYKVVGSIDLREGDEPYGEDEGFFEQLGLLDPLLVDPLGRETIDSAKRSRQAATELPAEIRDVVQIYLARGENKYGDEEDAGDKRPLMMAVDASSATDAVVTSGSYVSLPFVDLLRHYMKWGGFPGLAAEAASDRDPDWDGLAVLTAGLEEF